MVNEVAVGQVTASKIKEMSTLSRNGVVSIDEQNESSKEWVGRRT